MEIPKVTANDITRIAAFLNTSFWSPGQIADVLNRILEERAEEQERVNRKATRPNCF